MARSNAIRSLWLVGAATAVVLSVVVTFRVGPARGHGAVTSRGAGGEPCLSAILFTREHKVTADGVVVDTESRDRFVRCDGRVWIERILPADAPRSPAPSHDRDLPPLHRFARLVTRAEGGAKDEGSLVLVSRVDHLAVGVDPGSFGQVGFSGSYAQVASILAPDRKASLTEDGRAAPPGARWLTRRDASGAVDVLWSDELALTLVLETRRADGSSTVRITVDELALEVPRPAPWDGIDTLPRRELMDYGD